MMFQNTDSLFYHDYSVNRGIVLSYNFYTDTLTIYPNKNEYYIIDLDGFNPHNHLRWLRKHVTPILKSINRGFTDHDLYDIGRSIVQLTRRYWISNPVKHISESMCNQFQKLIRAHANIKDGNSYEECELYQQERKKFINKFNWPIYHFLVLSVRGYGFNLDDYSLHDFNAFMNKIVDKEEISAIQCYRP